jgi:spermidine synthase
MNASPTSSLRPGLAILVLSCGVLGYEISLMRILLYASWHHFAFLVLSTALLGFGASGTALCLAGRRLERRGDTAIFVLVLLTAFSLPAASRLAAEIPADARFLPALLGKQIGAWVLYWAVWFVPFFLGAAAIGLALAVSRDRVPTVYGFNLLGSAVGACAAPVAMSLVHPKWLPVIMGCVTLAGAFPLRPARSRRGVFWVALTGAGILAFTAIVPPKIRVDPFKYASYVRDLEKDGRASVAARAYSPRSVVEIYSGDVFHEIAFLSPGKVPPPLFAVTRDGHWAGSVLRVGRAEDASVVDNTMMAVPYAFVPARPSVLLLGETGGTNVWLAARRDARSVEVVQPDGEMIRVIRRELGSEGGSVFDLPAAAVREEEPRSFVDRSKERYDLIQLAALESWAVSAGALAGLQQDNLMTVEGIAACLDRLSPRGILTVCRAVETPPQTSAKILATLAEALARRGAGNPADHVVVVRDYLSSCIMARTAPWTPGEIANVRRVCSERELTPVFFPGIREDELNQPDRIPGPPGQPGDWLHYAAVSLFSNDAKRFIDEWPFDIRPPVDDRPFFDSFGKLGSIVLLERTYGDLWLTRTEIGLIFVIIAMLIIVAAGAVLAVVPLDVRPEIRRSKGRGAAAVYFAAIGLGYMIAEICVLSRLIRVLGDPVLSGAVTIAGFLFFSGTGAIVSQRIDPSRAALVRALLAAISAVCVIAWAASGRLAGSLGSQGLAPRILAAVVVIAPAAFLMGFPMALGLRRIAKTEPALVPWAWGVNGFASVLAPPLATAIALSNGFTAAGAAAIASYVLACAAYRHLPGGRTAE